MGEAPDCSQAVEVNFKPGDDIVDAKVAVTFEKEDGSPFDADGKGTSDLDVTLIGGKVMECWHEDEFYIPTLHTKPLGDKAPEIAPALNPLREKLQQMARRPVNFQATSNMILFARDVIFDQPYFIIIEATEEDS